MTETMTTYTCPECDAQMNFDRAKLKHEVFDCPECGVELELVSVTPIVLAIAPAFEEDWGE